MVEASEWFTGPMPEVVVIDYEQVRNNIDWAAYDKMGEQACLEADQEAARALI